MSTVVVSVVAENGFPGAFTFRPFGQFFQRLFRPRAVDAVCGTTRLSELRGNTHDVRTQAFSHCGPDRPGRRVRDPDKARTRVAGFMVGHNNRPHAG